MKRVALTGVPLSGKTTVAAGLSERGYMWINFTDLLKSMLCVALAAVGVELTVAEIHANKEYYRPLIIEFGHIIRFDTEPKYVREALEPWLRDQERPVVFDSALFPEQMDVLSEYDFQAVHLVVAGYERYERFKKLGMSVEEFGRLNQLGRELPLSMTSLVVDGGQPVDEIINQIIAH